MRKHDNVVVLPLSISRVEYIASSRDPDPVASTRTFVRLELPPATEQRGRRPHRLVGLGETNELICTHLDSYHQGSSVSLLPIPRLLKPPVLDHLLLLQHCVSTQLSIALYLDENRTISPSNKLNFTRNVRPVIKSRSVMPSKHTIDGEIRVQERQDLLSTRSAAPVSHQVADNGEERDELYASLLHARVRRVADKLGVRARSLDVCEDGVALGAEGKSEEGGADVGGDACYDDLLFAACFDGGLKLGVVPGTDEIVK